MKKGINVKNTILIFIILFVVIIAVDVIFLNDNYYEGMFFKMDTQITIKGDGYNMDLATRDILEAIDEIELEMSAHNKNSTLYKLNKEKTAEVSGDTIKLLRLSQEVAEKSGNAFDIRIKPVMDVWGFGTDFPQKPDETRLAEALETVKGTEISIENNTVSLNNGKLDLGGIAKGHATDKAKEILEGYDKINYAVLNFGGNIFTYGKKPDGSKFRIDIDNGKDGVYATLSLDNAFVITSGGYERYFEQDGVKYHHIIDPQTGYPSENGLVSVTIVSDNGALGDALSTACFVRGLENGMRLAEEYKVGAVFLDENNNVYTVGDIDIQLYDGYTLINKKDTSN